MAILNREENSNRNVNSDVEHTILGPESAFDGKLTFDGKVRVDGNFRGEIHTKDVLFVGKTAKINAELHIGRIIINGEVRGNVKAAGAIEIKSTGQLYGDVETPSLIIEQGAIFEGSCKMKNLTAGKVMPIARQEIAKDNSAQKTKQA